MFQAVRVLNKKEDSNIVVQNSKGEIIHSVDEELKEITNYFENIFKQEDTTPIPNLKPQKLEKEITSEEVRLAVEKLKNNKSPGCDQINAELVKNSPEIVFEQIAQILNNIAETGNKPLELSLGQLIPLPKPGKPKGPVKNLRPIILLSILRKILAIIVVRRSFATIREEINITQAAYSPGRSTTELVYTFRALIEQAICAEDLSIHILLLDMSRAFDTIDRGILLNDLKNLLEPDLLHLVSLLLTDVQLEVKYQNKVGTRFKPDIGSPQGDCASPIWFIFYLHKALQNSKLSSSRNPELDIRHDHNYTKADKHRVTPKVQKAFTIDQQYADDTSWVTTNKTIITEIKQTIPTILTNKNLIVNQDKTEEYTISRNSDTDWRQCRYLGSLLGNSEDIAKRKQLACAAFSKNKKSLCSKEISLEVRLRIFKALIAPIFLYNSELWTLSKKDSTKIDTFQRKFLRQIIRRRKTKNTKLYKICNTIPWSLQIKERRLKWFGHLQRLPRGAPARIAYEEVTTKPVKKVRGGQPLTWLKTIERDLNSININIQKAIEISKNRDSYHNIVFRVMDKAQEKISSADADEM